MFNLGARKLIFHSSGVLSFPTKSNLQLVPLERRSCYLLELHTRNLQVHRSFRTRRSCSPEGLLRRWTGLRSWTLMTGLKLENRMRNQPESRKRSKLELHNLLQLVRRSYFRRKVHRSCCLRGRRSCYPMGPMEPRNCSWEIGSWQSFHLAFHFWASGLGIFWVRGQGQVWSFGTMAGHLMNSLERPGILLRCKLQGLRRAGRSTSTDPRQLSSRS